MPEQFDFFKKPPHELDEDERRKALGELDDVEYTDQSSVGNKSEVIEIKSEELDPNERLANLRNIEKIPYKNTRVFTGSEEQVIAQKAAIEKSKNEKIDKIIKKLKESIAGKKE